MTRQIKESAVRIQTSIGQRQGPFDFNAWPEDKPLLKIKGPTPGKLKVIKKAPPRPL